MTLFAFILLVAALVWGVSGPLRAAKKPVQRRGTAKKPVRLKALSVVLGGVAFIPLVLFIGSEQRAGEDGPQPPRLLVLPFEVLGQDEPGLADGLTTDITTQLASQTRFRVLPSVVSNQYRTALPSLERIADTHDVQFVLSGSVAHAVSGAEDRVRVTAQLVDIAAGAQQIWGEVFEERFDGMLGVRAQIADRVEAALAVAMTEEFRAGLSAADTDDFAAYNQYLQGKNFRRRILDPANSDKALEAFRTAAELDPDFAAAWAGIASTHVWRAVNFGRLETLPEARAALDRARALNPNDHDTRMAEALIAFQLDADLQTANARYRALAESSDHPVIRVQLADLAQRLGEWDESVEWAREAARLGHYDPLYSHVLSAALAGARRFQEARIVDQRTRSFPGSGLLPYAMRAAVNELADSGDVPAAWVHLQSLPQPAVARLMTSGFHPEERIILRTMASRLPRRDPVSGGPSTLLAGATLAHARGDARSAAVLYERAAATLEEVLEARTFLPLREPHLWAALAVAASGAGDRARASEALRAGATAATRLGDQYAEMLVRTTRLEIQAQGDDPVQASRAFGEERAAHRILTDGILRTDPLWTLPSPHSTD